MNKKANVLQVNASSKYGGVSAIILDYCRNMDHQKVKVDFLSPEKSSFRNFQEEIETEFQGHTHELGVSFHGIKKYLSLFPRFYKFLKEHHYDVVHINSGLLFYNLEIALICKLRKVPKVIIHSHSAITYKGVKKYIHSFVRNFIPFVATDYFGCSMKAIESMFPPRIIKKKKYVLIPNAINLKKYQYDTKTRKKIRKELGIENELVIGHVGRFVEVKNHEFLLSVFQELLKIQKDSKLLLVGDGELLPKIKGRAAEMGISKQVIFVGHSNQVKDYYQAMDAFVMPSFYEGLPVVSIEAQATGLPCFISDTVTTECKVSDAVFFLSLKKPPQEWANFIVENSTKQQRKSPVQAIQDAGYDISKEAKKLEKIYSE